MDPVFIIRKPLVTEKTTYAMNEQGRYSFEVDVKATKDQIKAAVEKVYNVKVVHVNTQTRKGRSRRMKYGVVVGPTIKRATVRLRAGDKIELF